MKAEINNKNKAKFFAQYYDQKIVFDSILIKEEPEWISDSFQYSSFVFEKLYIRLKPLSDISAEDAIECYDILYPGTKWPDDYKIKEAKSWFNDEYGIGTIKHKWIVGNVFDFLRSCGYLVPWMGLSCEELIESGWAKYKG